MWHPPLKSRSTITFHKCTHTDAGIRVQYTIGLRLFQVLLMLSEGRRPIVCCIPIPAPVGVHLCKYNRCSTHHLLTIHYLFGLRRHLCTAVHTEHHHYCNTEVKTVWGLIDGLVLYTLQSQLINRDFRKSKTPSESGSLSLL